MEGKIFSGGIEVLGSRKKDVLFACTSISIMDLAEEFDTVRWDLAKSSEAHLILHPIEYRSFKGILVNGRSSFTEDLEKSIKSKEGLKKLSTLLKDNGYNVSETRSNSVDAIGITHREKGIDITFKVEDKDMLRDTLRSFC